MTQRRLGLHLHEVDIVIDGVDRLRGVGHLPDDDRCDLHRVAVGVVDLQAVGLEVPDPNAQVPAVGQRHDAPQAGAADSADIGPEEPHDLGLAGLHDHQRARHEHAHDDRRRQPADREAGGDARSDHEHAGPAGDRPGGALVDFDTGSGVTDWCRLWLPVGPDVCTHGASNRTGAPLEK